MKQNNVKEELMNETEFEDNLLAKYFPQFDKSLQIPMHFANRAKVNPRNFANQFKALIDQHEGYV